MELPCNIVLAGSDCNGKGSEVYLDDPAICAGNLGKGPMWMCDCSEK